VHEGQPTEQVVGAEPDELGGSRVDLDTQIASTCSRIFDPVAVGGDHEVVAGQVVERDLGGEAQVGADVAGARLHHRQQGAARDRGHPVAAAADPLALEPDLDLVPVPAVLGQRLAQHRVGLVDPGQRPVGETPPRSRTCHRPGCARTP
jgi:hypothetical protein